MKRNAFDIAPQALLLSAGVILSVILISIMVAQFEQSKKMADVVSENIIATTGNIRNSDIVQYDGLRVKGAEVRNFFKMNMSENGSEKFDELVIDNGKGSREYRNSNAYKELTDPEADSYVSPMDLYMCEVEKNANGIITRVQFKIEE